MKLEEKDGGVLVLAARTKVWGDVGFMFGLMEAKAGNSVGSWKEGKWLRFSKTVNLFSWGIQEDKALLLSWGCADCLA